MWLALARLFFATAHAFWEITASLSLQSTIAAPSGSCRRNVESYCCSSKHADMQHTTQPSSWERFWEQLDLRVAASVHALGAPCFLIVPISEKCHFHGGDDSIAMLRGTAVVILWWAFGAALGELQLFKYILHLQIMRVIFENSFLCFLRDICHWLCSLSKAVKCQQSRRMGEPLFF